MHAQPDSLDKAPKLILVDDEPRVLRSLQAVFKHAYQVSVASNATLAKEIIKQLGPFDVLISDQRMPKILGHELLAWSRQQQPRCARILLAGNIDNIAQGESYDAAGIYKCVAKPWNNAEIKNLVKQAIVDNRLVEQKQVASKHSPRQPVDPAGSLRPSILVVDKSPSYTLLYQQLISKLGSPDRLHLATDEAGAMQTIKHDPQLSVLVADINIGEQAILQLSQGIKRLRPSIQTVISGAPSPLRQFVNAHRNLHIDQHLLKPASAARLAPLLKTWLQAPSNKKS